MPNARKPSEADAEIRAFVAERNAVFLRGNLAEVKAFFRKHNPGRALPDDAVIEIGLHKARCAVTTFPETEKEKSRAWLRERGYSLL